jgi:hypothetical protein
VKPHVHRTPEMKAQRIAQDLVRSQADLDDLLRQFSPAHHAGIIERLKPHLEFEPKAPQQ